MRRPDERVECQALGVAHIWTRILSVYGPHDGPATMISGTIRKLLHGEKPALTAGIQQWDYLYAADAAAAFYALAVSGQDGRVYPLGSGILTVLQGGESELYDTDDSSAHVNNARCARCLRRVIFVISPPVMPKAPHVANGLSQVAPMYKPCPRSE